MAYKLLFPECSQQDPTSAEVGEAGNSPFGEIRCQLAPYSEESGSDSGASGRRALRFKRLFH
jgi:hypothetical protein